MKFIILFSIITLFNFNAISNSQIKDTSVTKIKKYVNNQSNTIKLEVDYGNFKLKNKKVLQILKNKTIYHIDFVYSSFKTTNSFDQSVLNEKRINELNRLLSQFDLNNVEWKNYEQTLSQNSEEAKNLFHGFVIHYGNNINSKSQQVYFKDIQKPFSVIDIDNQNGGRVSYYTGSSIIMDEFAVTYQNGDTVIGVYQLYYREFRNSAEIALSGIPMTYTENNKNEIFNSAGMYEIVAKKDGEELVLQKPAIVNFQCTQILPDVSFFELSKNDMWHHSESINFEDESSDKYTDKGHRYSISVNGEDLGDIKISTSKYKPEKFIDQGAYQGYSRLKQLMTISKDQIFIELNNRSWIKFKILYDLPNSNIKAISSELEENKKCLLITRDSATMFIESVMEQKMADLNVDVVGKGTNVYTCSSNMEKGLTNIVGDEPIPPSPGLVMGLKSANFGVYNCDQTKRIIAPLALSPSYFDRNTGEKIEELYVACVIDMDINGSLSYHPNHLVCNSKGNTKVLLFTISKGIYLFDEEDFKTLDLSQSNVNMNMLNITSSVKDCDDLKKILNFEKTPK